MRVLIADKLVWLRSALRLLLEQQPNIEVVGEVGNARALSALTASFQPDLIVLDWELTDMKTPAARRQVIAAVRSMQPQVYILALTSSYQTESHLLTATADAFVSKGEPPAQVLAAVRQAEAAYAHHGMCLTNVRREAT